MGRDTLARFNEKYIPVTESGCWIWTDHVLSTGYGALSVNGKYVYAHRLAYELHKGPIPEGLQIDHLCRVRCCVNPDHLEVVTHRENALRGESISAKYARRTHCKHGHPLIGENLYYVRTRPHARICATCMRRHNIATNMRRRKTIGSGRLKRRSNFH